MQESEGIGTEAAKRRPPPCPPPKLGEGWEGMLRFRRQRRQYIGRLQWVEVVIRSQPRHAFIEETVTLGGRTGAIQGVVQGSISLTNLIAPRRERLRIA